jgi:hypothetical protein
LQRSTVRLSKIETVTIEHVTIAAVSAMRVKEG